MKRLIVLFIILFVIMNFISCNNNVNERVIKIGVIDSCISEEMLKYFNIKQLNDITGISTKNNITHGSMILSIITKNNPKVEIFYCSVLNESLVGEISDMSIAINWCVEQKVDIITMSLATLKNDNDLQESIKNALDSKTIVIAFCINFSDKTCYPAMYEGVVSVSEGFNPNALIILKSKKIKFNIDCKDFEKSDVSYLTAYVCSKYAEQLSKGKEVEKIDFG